MPKKTRITIATTSATSPIMARKLGWSRRSFTGSRRVLAAVALVAVVVALVILVFFALGYAFGRAFL